jgi:dTDP-4-amino-4,6-dideoxygalactose transaminase
MTIPRYLPAVDLPARVAAITGAAPAAALHRLREMLGLEGWRTLLPVPSARAAIATYFKGLAERDERRLVLVSAQLCPIVPKLLKALGFYSAAVDVDDDVPMPGPDRMLAAFEECGGAKHVAAVIVAPLYGYMPQRFDGFSGRLGGVPVLLDLAQATFLGRGSPLLSGADAAVFSFGIGKGLDLGGGLFALRRAEPPAAAAVSSAPLSGFTGLAEAVTLRAAVVSGLYPRLVRYLDRAVEADKDDVAVALRSAGKVLPARVTVAYAERLARFAEEVELARRRAKTLSEASSIQRACAHGRVFFDVHAMHLRQIVRLKEAERRDAVLAGLRDAGIDAMPAGEPTPDAYLRPEDFVVPPSSAGHPNARRFCADAIRLPFLGRLGERQFTTLLSRLETVLAERV